MWKVVVVLFIVIVITVSCHRGRNEQLNITDEVLNFNNPEKITEEQCDSILAEARQLPDREKCLLYLKVVPRMFSSLVRDEGIELLQEALAVAPKDLRNTVRVGILEYCTAQFAIVRKRIMISEKIRELGARQILDMEEEHLTEQEWLRFSMAKVRFYFYQGNMEESIPILLKCLENRRKKQDREGERIFLFELMRSYSILCDYEKTIHYCNLLLTDFSGELGERTKSVYAAQSIAYKGLGNYDEAIRLYKKCREDGEVFSPKYMAAMYMAKGDGVQARYWLSICNVNNIHQKKHTQMLIADSYDCEGKVDSAAFARQEIFRMDAPDSPIMGSVYRKYGDWLWNKQRHDEALEYYSKSAGVPFSFKRSAEYKKQLLFLKQYYDRCMELNRPMEAFKVLRQLDSCNRECNRMELEDRDQKLAAQSFSKELLVRVNLQREKISRQNQWLWGSVCGIVLVASVAGMGWFQYHRKKRTLDLLYQKQKEIEMSTRPVEYEENPDEESREVVLFRKMNQLLKKEKLFRNPNFTLDELAISVGTNRTYASNTINTCAGMNFSQWIQKLRVDHFTSRLRELDYDVERAYREAGFSSSSSFYRSFKQHTGLTPLQYIERDKKTLK